MHSVVGIWNGSKFQKAWPLVYNGSQWVPLQISVYNGSEWETVGQSDTLYVQLIESANKNVIDKNSNAFLVRDE